MRGYFGLGQLSATEKSDILDQHKSVYNGYQTMQPQVSNTQPLTVYDFAGDKEGLVVNNKGEVKKYTNMGINEQVSKKSMCECGGEMYEGECMECGYKDGMSEEDDSDWDATLMDGLEEETGHLDDIYKVKDLNLKHGDFDYVEGGGNDVDTFEGMHKNLYREDESDDFVNYNDNFEDPDNEDDGFEDLNSAEMGEDETDDKPYEKGKFGMKASRARASFEPTPKEKDILAKLFGQYGDDIPPIVIRYLRKLPRKVFTKRLVDLGLVDLEKSSNGEIDELGTHELEKGRKYRYSTPSFEDEIEFDDEHEDKNHGEKMYHFKGKDSMSHLMPGKHIERFVDNLDEQGGNSYDMDVDDVEPAYDFESNGPDSVYPVNEDGECEECWEPMESAWADEIDEVDISGSQGVYSDMDPAFDFDSEGPGKAGPYQEFSYEGETDEQYLPAHAWKKMKRQQDAKDKGEDFDDDEFDPSDYEGLDAMSSWEDIKSHFGDTDWSEIDEDLQESFQTQKNKIMEMFNRFNKYN